MAIDLVGIVVRLVLVFATTILFSIVFLAYLRMRNRKMLLISAGFGLHLAYALLSLPEVFAQTLVIDEDLHLLLHAVALSFILLGILKDSDDVQR
jgi:hypothetical protein